VYAPASPVWRGAARAIKPSQLPVRRSGVLGVHQRAILRNGRAHIATSLRADVLSQRKGIALQLTGLKIERLSHQCLVAGEQQMAGGVGYR
jgi:hypothetical protein